MKVLNSTLLVDCDVRMAALRVAVSPKNFCACLASGGWVFWGARTVRFQLSYFCVNPGCSLSKCSHGCCWKEAE